MIMHQLRFLDAVSNTDCDKLGKDIKIQGDYGERSMDHLHGDYRDELAI